jgi:tetratricopeptide (TPR) repeat protein
MRSRPNSARMTTSINELRREYDHQIHKAFDQAERLSRQGRHRAAIQVFDHILDAVPDYSEARNNRALEFEALGNADRAIEELQHVLAIDSAFKLAYANLAVILCNQRRFREAESITREAIHLFGEWPKANLTLAVAVMGQGQLTSKTQELMKPAAGQHKTAEGLWEIRRKLSALSSLFDYLCERFVA